jgi:hypothetical protein
MKPIAAFLVVLLLAALPCRAQPASPTSAEAVIMHFYSDPRPERLVGYFELYERGAHSWIAFPPLVGFYAVVFRGHPDWIDRLTPAKPSPSGAATLASSLRLAGLAATRRDLLDRLATVGSEPTLKAQLAGLPTQLDSLVATTPTHLDILWGASFASGDGRYPRMVIDVLARTANRSDDVAIDIAKLVLALVNHDRDFPAQVKSKYGEAMAIQMAYAATAAWALSANARQHPFVDKVVTDYATSNAQTPTGRLLAVLHKK